MRTLTQIRRAFQSHEADIRMVGQYNIPTGKQPFHGDYKIAIDPETLASVIAKQLAKEYRDKVKAYHCSEMEMLLTIDAETIWLKFNYILEFKNDKPIFFRWMPEKPFRKAGQPIIWRLTSYENLNDLVVEYIEYFDRTFNNNQKSKS